MRNPFCLISILHTRVRNSSKAVLSGRESDNLVRSTLFLLDHVNLAESAPSTVPVQQEEDVPVLSIEANIDFADSVQPSSTSLPRDRQPFTILDFPWT